MTLANYYLWSYQPITVVEQIQSQDPYIPDWKHVYTPWQVAYRHMNLLMKQKGIPIGDNPPFWAWKLGTSRLQKPSWNDAADLFGGQEGLQYEKVQVIEFEAPTNLVLLSSYAYYNELVLYKSIMGRPILPKYTRRCLKTKNRPRYDSVQACLPYFDRKWIISIKSITAYQSSP